MGGRKVKKEGSLKLVLSLLFIVLLVLVSIGGIYVKDKNIMKNILPEYILGMDLDTNTIIKLEVSKTEQDSSENTKEENAENEEAVEGEDNTKDNAEEESSDKNENGQAQEDIYTVDNYKKSKKIIENR